jgi:hypothetical protein
MAGPQPTLLSDAPPAALRLRAPGEERLLPLRRGITALGADERCPLRVQAKGVQPWHCLLTQGEKRTIVHRLAPQARINGQSFVEAVLHAGDRLEIGSIELELVGGAEPCPLETDVPENTAQNASNPDLACSDGNPPDPLDRIEALQARLQELEDQRPGSMVRAREALLIQAIDQRRLLARSARKLRRKGRRLAAAAMALERQWAQRERRLGGDDSAGRRAAEKWAESLAPLRSELTQCCEGLAELIARQAGWQSERALIERRLTELTAVSVEGRGRMDQLALQWTAQSADFAALADGWRHQLDARAAADRRIEAEWSERCAADDARWQSLAARLGELASQLERESADRLEQAASSSRLIETEGRLARLQDHIGQLADRVETMAKDRTAEASAVRDAVDRLAGENAHLGNRLESLAAHAQYEAAIRIEQGAAAEKARAEAESVLTVLCERLDSLHGRLDAVSAGMQAETRIESEIAAWEGRLGELRDHGRQLEARVEQEAANRMARDSEAAGALAELSGQLAEVRARLESVASGVAANGAESDPSRDIGTAAVAETSAQISELQAALKQLTERVDQLAGDHRPIEGRLDQLTAVAANPDERMTARCQSIEADMAELRGQLAMLQEEREVLRQQQCRAQEQLSIRSEQIDRKLESLAVQQQALHHRHDASATDEPLHSAAHGHRSPLDRLAELQAEREVREQEQRRARAEQLLARHIEGRAVEGRAGHDAGQPHQAATGDDARRAPLPDVEPPVDFPAEAADTVDPVVPRESELTAREVTAFSDDTQHSPVLDGGPEATPKRSSDQEVLRRLVREEPPDRANMDPSVLAEEVSAHAAESPQPIADTPPVAAQPRPAAGRQTQPAAEESDESIEDYMARLMNRVRGITAAPPARNTPAEPPVASRPENDATTTARTAVLAERANPTADEDPKRPADAPKSAEIRRRPPPERMVDLSAMRELANMNARSAIDMHSKKRLGRERNSKLLLAFLAGIACLALVALGNLANPLNLAAIATSGLTSLVYLWRCLKLGGGRSSPPSPPVAGITKEEPATVPPGGNDAAAELATP